MIDAASRCFRSHQSADQEDDRHYGEPEGPPLIVRHRDCGGTVTDHLSCSKCGAELTPYDVEPTPGPGAVHAAA